jgi:glucose 1-dehydrogenase
MRLQGRAAIITGAAGGIGRAIAERFLDEGARVLIADIDAGRGEATRRSLSERGETHFLQTDVGSQADARRLAAAAQDIFGGIDILVNNAGIVHDADFLDLEEEDFDRVMRINLKSVFLVGQAVARAMVDRVRRGGRPGAIVNMSSINAVVAIASQSPYSVSKAGVTQLTKVMALSLAHHGIRVNAIGPGSTNTEMMATVHHDPAAKERVLSRTPLGRFGEPSEIAGVALFLASDDAGFVTGQTVYADGGRLALNYLEPAKG